MEKNKKAQANKRYTTNVQNCTNSKTKLTKLVHGKTKRLKHKKNASVSTIEEYLCKICVTKEGNTHTANYKYYTANYNTAKTKSYRTNKKSYTLKTNKKKKRWVKNK